MNLLKKITTVVMITSLMLTMTVPWTISDAFAVTQKSLIKGVEDTTIEAKIEMNSAGKIEVRWTKSDGFKVDYYELFRAKGLEAGFEFRCKRDYPTKAVTISEKNANRYCYKVRGVREINGAKYYTQWSNIVYYGAIPENIEAKSYAENIVLTWDRMDGVETYKVRYYVKKHYDKARKTRDKAQQIDDRISYDVTNDIITGGVMEGNTYYFTVAVDGGLESQKIEIKKTSEEMRPDAVPGADFGNDAISSTFMIKKNPEQVNDLDYYKVQVGNKLGNRLSHRITIDMHLFDTDVVAIASSLFGYRLPHSSFKPEVKDVYLDISCLAEFYKIKHNISRADVLTSGVNYIYIPKALFSKSAYDENISAAEQIYNLYSKSFADNDVGEAYFDFSDTVLDGAKLSVPMAWNYIDDGKTYIVLLCPESNEKPLTVKESKGVNTYSGYMQTFIIGEDTMDIVMQTVNMKVNTKYF